jgi:hypothetical protein
MTSRTLTRLRLASQILTLGLFLFLLVRTEFPGTIRTASPDIRVPYPVGLFLETDPLVAVATALATHSLYRHLIWAVPFLLLALVVGRAFCGWMCPLGTLHHFVGSWRSEAKRGAAWIASNRYKRWQATKYYILFAVLVMALFGSAFGLALDPLSFLVRSMSVSVMPAVNYGVRAVLDAAWALPFSPVRAACCSSSSSPSTSASRGSGAGPSARLAGCSASCLAGRRSSCASTTRRARTAADACSIAREATIRFPARRGGKPSATCA